MGNSFAINTIRLVFLNHQTSVLIIVKITSFKKSTHKYYKSQNNKIIG